MTMLHAEILISGTGDAAKRHYPSLDASAALCGASTRRMVPASVGTATRWCGACLTARNREKREVRGG